MGRFDSECRLLVESAPRAHAAAVVDLNTGLIDGMHHDLSVLSQTTIDAMCAAAQEWLLGTATQNVQKLMNPSGGAHTSPMLASMHFKTSYTEHFVKVLPRMQNFVLVLVTDADVDVREVWEFIHGSRLVTEPITG